MNELHAKAIQATARFIERKGYKVLATQWESPDGATADLVADDDGTICFIGAFDADVVRRLPQVAASNGILVSALPH